MMMSVRGTAVAVGGLIGLLLIGFASAPARGQTRTLGIDVSSWQGEMNWNTAYDAGARFAFVRSSRGGTTAATGYVVDDQFDRNMQEIDALAQQGKTIYAGAYHYARPDTIGSVINTTTIRSHAEDQAQHFYNTAGNYMTEGYLRPVLDLEDGAAELTTPEMSLWVNSFSDHLRQLSGVEPLIYLNTYYATHQVDESVNHHDLWLARYNTPPVDPFENKDNPETPDGYPNPYGVWNDPIGSDVPSHDAWSFWQYSAGGNGMGSTFGSPIHNDIDLNAANGDLDFVRGFLVPEPTGVALAACGSLLLLRRRR